MTKDILTDIKAGMDVFDSSGIRLGKVEYVYFGEPDEMAPTISGPQDRVQQPLVDIIAEAFSPVDQVPEEVRERLLREGFIRVGGNILPGKDRYINEQHIGSVEDEDVKLNIQQDALLTE